VRRWAERLVHVGTLLATKLWQAAGWSTAMFPTIFAWDWTAIRRILPIEARSPDDIFSRPEAVAHCYEDRGMGGLVERASHENTESRVALGRRER
jgi:hypothetical protein